MKLWVVGKALGPSDAWEFIGVFSSEKLAIAACEVPECWVAPCTLDEAFPVVERVDWPGAYYPAMVEQ